MESHLLERWAADHPVLPVTDLASISQARNQVRAVGASAGLSDQKIQELLIVVTELAQNQLRHAITGEIVVHEISQFGAVGVEIIAIDHGSGIVDPETALAGSATCDHTSLKSGLAAVYRLSDVLDIDTRIGEGTCIWAKKFVSPPRSACEAAIFGRPYPGELRSGDNATFDWSGGNLVLGVADGFGHGIAARQSSEAAIGAVLEFHAVGFDRILSSLNQRLQGMRGVMLALGHLDFAARSLDIACLGDVSGALIHRSQATHFIGQTGHLPGQANLRPFKVPSERFPLSPGDLLVLHTDGVRDVCATVMDNPELRRRPALVIAQRLLEDLGRENDDALVLVVRMAPKGAI